MKSDTQHLDYLISQYMDGCLDPSSKKSLEQTLVNDPQARKLYKDQRDVQDMLDDWGNRIPMIHWDQFDKQLADRLQHETVGGGRTNIFRRWAKPMSIAASLFLAASIGYAWHAFSTTTPANPIATNTTTLPTQIQKVHLDDGIASYKASRRSFSIDEPGAMSVSQPAAGDVEVTSPDDSVAATSMQDAIKYGMGGDIKAPGSVTAFDPTYSQPTTKTQKLPKPTTEDPTQYQYP